MNPIFTIKSLIPVILIAASIILYLIIAPNFDLIPWSYYGYDDKRIGQLFIIILVYSVLILCSSSRRHFLNIFSLLPRSTPSILLIVFLLAVLSSWQAPSPHYAFLELGLYIGLASLIISLASITLRYGLISIVLLSITLLISIALYETGFITGYLASFIEGIPLNSLDLFGGFANIRFLNQFMVWTLPLIILPTLIYPKLDHRIKKTILFIGIVWIWVLLTTHSRGAVGSYVISLALTFLIFRHDSARFIKTNLYVLLAGTIVYFLTMHLIPYGIDVFKNTPQVISAPNLHHLTNINTRLDLWDSAFGYIQSNPLLGIGPMHYAWAASNHHYHPHNSILQWSAELGIPSLLLMLTLVLWGLVSWVQRFKQHISTGQFSEQMKYTWVALFSSLCTGLIYSLVSGVIVMPMSQVMMAIVIGIMLGLYFRTSNLEYPLIEINRTTHLTTIVIGIVLIGLIYSVLPDLIIRLNQVEYLQNAETHVWRPRFWMVGEIPK